MFRRHTPILVAQENCVSRKRTIEKHACDAELAFKTRSLFARKILACHICVQIEDKCLACSTI